MGDIGDQIRFHLLILHAGAYRLADTLSDVIDCIRHLTPDSPVETDYTGSVS